MPIISSFFGIVIRMYYQEDGIAHFHAEYQGYQATFTFDGKPPGRSDASDGSKAGQGMGDGPYQ